MNPAELIAEYVRGPELLEKAVAGMTDSQLDARPIAGKWSSREVVCHLADCEILYAQRMARVICEDKPALANADPNALRTHLAYDRRSVAEELAIVRAIRTSLARILKEQPAQAFERVGMHSTDGPLTLLELLRRITGHIPHHVRFIDEKRKVLG